MTGSRSHASISWQPSLRRAHRRSSGNPRSFSEKLRVNVSGSLARKNHRRPPHFICTAGVLIEQCLPWCSTLSGIKKQEPNLRRHCSFDPSAEVNSSPHLPSVAQRPSILSSFSASPGWRGSFPAFTEQSRGEGLEAATSASRREEPRSSDPPISAQRAPPAASPTRRRRRGDSTGIIFTGTAGTGRWRTSPSSSRRMGTHESCLRARGAASGAAASSPAFSGSRDRRGGN